MIYKILIDISHNEQVESFPDAFNEDDFIIEFINKNEGPLTYDMLEDFDLLILGNIQHSKNNKDDKFTPEELKAIKEFVGKGGSLLVTTGAGGDKDMSIKQGSIRVLYKLTGVKKYWNGVIRYPKRNSIIDNVNLKIDTIFQHPITDGVSRLILGNCTFFSITEDAEDIITTSENASFEYFDLKEIDEIGQVPICVISEFYNGRVVTLGSSSIFFEDDEIGIDIADNHKFLENTIRWLCFDKEEIIVEEEDKEEEEDEDDEEEEEEDFEEDSFF